MKFTLLIFLVLLFSCVEQDGSKNSDDIQFNESSMVAYKDYIWKEKKLNVVFLDGPIELQNDVIVAAKLWTRYANIDFVFYNKKSSLPEGEYPHIRVTFNGSGNSSYVGRSSTLVDGNLPTVNFLNFENLFSIERKDTIFHEFGHVLGLAHEHINPNRTFVFTSVEQVLEYCEENWSMDEARCRSQVVGVATDNKYFWGEYDSRSIMHYHLDESIAVDLEEFENVRTLSYLDKFNIAKIYPGRVDLKNIKHMHDFDIFKFELEKFRHRNQVKNFGKCTIELSESNEFPHFIADIETLESVDGYIYPDFNQAVRKMRKIKECKQRPVIVWQ